ncbi:MAG TPA: hypothetical protein VNB24_04475, partial [Acidimicrobiales bacterium]|nr:hypothetical protein [Acidimicrobiales bacterium]
MKRLFILGAAVLAALAPFSVAPAHADGVTVVVEGCPVTVPDGSNGLVVLDTAVASGCPTVTSYQQSGGFLNCLNGVCGISVMDKNRGDPLFVGTY